MYIELPRNFLFIKKLPIKFLLDVLSETNKTSKGIWYKVKINNHQLNILSESKLKIGKKYSIEKQEGTKLKIINEILLSSEKEEIEKISQKIVSKENLFTQEIIKTDYTNMFFADFFTALTVSFMQQNSDNINIEEENNNYFFTFNNFENPVEGVFVNNKNSWKLYFCFDYIKENNKKEIQNKLKELLFDLSISDIVFTNSSHIQSLKTGIHLWS